jgi:hypothetical protein
MFPVRAAEFGTARQMAVTAAEGAPISVVPVSMAAVFKLPMLTVLPPTVTPVTCPYEVPQFRQSEARA